MQRYLHSRQYTTGWLQSNLQNLTCLRREGKLILLDSEAIIRKVWYSQVLSDFYYKYCSIKSTGLINCTGFLLRVLVLNLMKALTAKRTVSIKSTGLINCTGILLSLLYYILV